MYYENKRTFYIKQYGPAVAMIMLSVVVIVVGLVIGLGGSTPKENNAYVYSKQAITGTVKSVKGLTITLVSEGEEYFINMIGIEENKNNKDLSKTISNDLIGKTIIVDFDTVKSEKGKTYGYIYLDNTFYNEKLLENGLAELRAERNNINKLDVLLEAQIKARHEGKGIWSY